MGIFDGIGTQIKENIQWGLRNEADRARNQAQTAARIAVYEGIERPINGAIERTMGGLEQSVRRGIGLEDPRYQQRSGYYGTPGFNPYPQQYGAPQGGGYSGYGQPQSQYGQRPAPEISTAQYAALERQKYRRENNLPDNAPVPGYGTGAASPPPSTTTAGPAAPAAPASPPPAAPAAPAAAAVPAAAAAKPVEMAVQQQQAYLKVLGYNTGPLDGIESRKDGKESKTEAAFKKFAQDHGIDPKDKNAVKQALLDEIKHSNKAKDFMDKVRANPDGLSAEDKKAAQWTLKGQQGVEMPKSERNGKMDGDFGKAGSETRTLLKKPYDYTITENAPATRGVQAQAIVSVTPTPKEAFTRAADSQAYEAIQKAALSSRQEVQRTATVTLSDNPTAEELTRQGGLNANDFVDAFAKEQVNRLTNKPAPAGPAQDGSSVQATRKLDTMNMG